MKILLTGTRAPVSSGAGMLSGAAHLPDYIKIVGVPGS
jgi:hypothetical protein